MHPYLRHLYIKAIALFCNPLAQVAYDPERQMTWITE